jgi:hypothetical protein
MNYFSDFQPNKIYNYKTLSLDGTKTAQEKNVKYLFGFSQNSHIEVEMFFFSETFGKYHTKNGLSFDEKKKKKINDKRCRYILCEVETVLYDIQGNEYGRQTSLEIHDKTSDIFTLIKGKKVRYKFANKQAQSSTRSFSITYKIDEQGNEREVLTPGGIHYGTKPGNLNPNRVTFLGVIQAVEVKTIDELTII